MKIVRWPECDILESDLKVVDEFYTKTNKGLIFTAYLFPLHELTKLQDLKVKIETKKKELSDIEGEIYKVSRDFKK